ncbi:MAG: WYL domain-containing protein [Nibricoccus sp.]
MLRIHEDLRRGAMTNCTQLMHDLEVSRKTVVRDIAYMRDQLDLPIEFDAQLNAYRYTHPVSSFPTVEVTEGELMALLVARRAVEQYQGTPFHRQLEIAFDKLTEGLKDRISFSPAEELSAVSFKNMGLGKADLVVFNTLSTAVLKQLEVTFDYRKPGDARASRRSVQPYHLSHRQNLWYLVGHDVERKALRTFALPRIADVRTTKTTFSRPQDFSPENFFSNALGVLGGSGNYQVRVRFTAKVADRVRERVWHDSQALLELPNGGVELSMKLGALPEVESWILSWGSDAEVLAPAELRKSIKAAVRRLTQQYR